MLQPICMKDRFGEDLQHGQRIVGGPKMSVSHTVHNWKTPATEKAEIPASGLERHVLFGHTGDMRDPHTNLQKSEFTTASQYFLQDPATIPGVGTLTADGYTADGLTVGAQAGAAGNMPNHFVAKMRAGWGDMRQSHALPPNERFLSETKKAFATQPGSHDRPARVSEPPCSRCHPHSWSRRSKAARHPLIVFLGTTKSSRAITTR
ncbi:unnamed protein product [Durusdinium trenchii]|uniref:Uncharacterized protein n=1 Tax=Durusdinium trenchii TaxID=1381693 RepID=A0ABP0SH38_9DINO